MRLAGETAAVRQLGQIRQIPGVVQGVERAAHQRITQIQAVHAAKRVAQVLQVSRSSLQLLQTPVARQWSQGKEVWPEHGREASLQVLWQPQEAVQRITHQGRRGLQLLTAAATAARVRAARGVRRRGAAGGLAAQVQVIWRAEVMRVRRRGSRWTRRRGVRRGVRRRGGGAIEAGAMHALHVLQELPR